MSAKEEWIKSVLNAVKQEAVKRAVHLDSCRAIVDPDDGSVYIQALVLRLDGSLQCCSMPLEPAIVAQFVTLAEATAGII